jgi:hypothetical protein
MSDPVQVYTITEGPTDVTVIKALLEFLGRRYTLTPLQPEGDGIDGLVNSEHGFGWRDGVRAYCQRERDIIDASLQFGVVIIHVDADVARKNKEDFDRDLTRPCPPAQATCNEVRREIVDWLGVETPPAGLVLCVPAQSIETWVVAALKPEVPVQLFKTRLSKATNKEKARLRALGPGVLFECRPDPETLLAQVDLDKSPEAFDGARKRLANGWKHARDLPESLRFESELRQCFVDSAPTGSIRHTRPRTRRTAEELLSFEKP